MTLTFQGLVLARRMAARAAAPGLLVAALLFSSSPAAACSAAGPRLSDVRTATYVVVATVVDAPSTGSALTLEVKRSLFGDASGSIRPTKIITSLCGDRASANIGDELVFARHLAFHGHTLDAYWHFGSDRKLDASTVERFRPGVDTVESVVAALRAALPDTSKESEGNFPVAAWVLALVGALFAARAVTRRTTEVRGTSITD